MTLILSNYLTFDLQHPVRRKQIQLEFQQRASANNDKILNDIKRNIEKLALCRFQVSWTLIDLSSQSKAMVVKPVSLARYYEGEERSLIPFNSSASHH